MPTAKYLSNPRSLRHDLFERLWGQSWCPSLWNKVCNLQALFRKAFSSFNFIYILHHHFSFFDQQWPCLFFHLFSSLWWSKLSKLTVTNWALYVCTWSFISQKAKMNKYNVHGALEFCSLAWGLGTNNISSWFIEYQYTANGLWGHFYVERDWWDK